DPADQGPDAGFCRAQLALGVRVDRGDRQKADQGRGGKSYQETSLAPGPGASHGAPSGADRVTKDRGNRQRAAPNELQQPFPPISASPSSRLRRDSAPSVWRDLLQAPNAVADSPTNAGAVFLAPRRCRSTAGGPDDRHGCEVP